MALFAAAQSGDVESLSLLIEQGVSVNEVDKDGCTPLILASKEGHDEACKWLVMAGANIDHVDKGLGGTSLLFACIGGHHATVQVLLEAGASPNIPFDSPDLITPLMFSVQHAGLSRLRKEPWASQGAIVLHLLKAGASVSALDKDGRSPLIFAVELGHPEVTQYLISAGADVNLGDKNGTTPLMYACKEGHLEVCTILLSNGAEAGATAPGKGSSSIHFAGSGGNPRVVKLLLDAGVQVDTQNGSGDTCLSLAVAGGKVGLVGWLVEKSGARLDILDKEGRSCLDLAALMLTLNKEDASRKVILDYLKKKGALPVLFKGGDLESVKEADEKK